MKLLLIGGTGIVGKAIIDEALKRQCEVTAIGLEMDKNISSKVNQVIVNRENEEEFKEKCNNLENKWDIVVDIFEFNKKSAKQTHKYFKDISNHIFILSTVLVYDRAKEHPLPIKSNHQLSKKGELGGYVDHKLEVERYWEKVNDVNWTILRPYHILGETESLLGCIPDHNRDPRLLDKIKNGESLELCEGGEVNFNFINPTDIANIVFAAYNNPRSFNKAYNLVNPSIITAKYYYELIAKELNKELKIINKSVKDVWKDNKGWQLTTLPHVYDVSDLEQDIGFVPRIPIEKTIKDVIKNFESQDIEFSKLAVHQRMTLLPRPKPIGWLLNKK